jgi:hypothetical protein
MYMALVTGTACGSGGRAPPLRDRVDRAARLGIVGAGRWEGARRASQPASYWKPTGWRCEHSSAVHIHTEAGPRAVRVPYIAWVEHRNVRRA